MRSTAETLALDMSLRHARTIYVSLAAFIAPFAFFAVIALFNKLGNMTAFSGSSILLSALWAAIVCGGEYQMLSQWIEANRRLEILREHPEQPVRKMSAPFQSSLFGPYH
jgi:hypothetical protein